MNIIQELKNKELISPPRWLPDNIVYLTMMGSHAYATFNENSDFDLYGIVVPPKEYIFPSLYGYIAGFEKPPGFDVWQQSHIVHPNGKEYDFQVYNIAKFFQLAAQNNPNIIDALFVPLNCIAHITPVGQLIRDNRYIFLHAGAWHRFRGYAYAQMTKMEGRNIEGKRKELVDKHGYDVKFASHVVRLIDEVEQILIEGDIDLTRTAETLKSIRRGEWKAEEIRSYFKDKEKILTEWYSKTKLPHQPNLEKIKALLITCLEQQYGKIENVSFERKSSDLVVADIIKVLDRYGIK
jgi:predicted nucleotidyltransferase